MFGFGPEGTRGGLDLFHFAVTFAGFVFAIGGVVISSTCVCCCGLVILAWGLAYFTANNEDV
jgi:hypothetical protein